MGHGQGQGWIHTRKGRISRPCQQSVSTSRVRCEGLHTTEGSLPSFPLSSSYVQQPFPGSLRQKCPEEMCVHFSPGVSGLDVFDVRPCPQVSRWVRAHHLQGPREDTESGWSITRHRRRGPKVPFRSFSGAPGSLFGQATKNSCRDADGS